MGALDGSPETLRAFRDTIVRALVAAPPGREPFAYLAQLGDAGAALHVAALGQPLVLLQWEGDDDDSLARLAGRVRHVAAGAFSKGSHVAIVGGDDDAVRAFVQRIQLDGRVSLHHVGLHGHVWTRGRPLGALNEAAREIAESGRLLPPIDPAEVTSQQSRFQELAEAEDTFRRTLVARKPRATVGIIVACGVLYALEFLWGNGVLTELRMGAVEGELIRQGEWWRLLSGTFLHASPMHIGANMWSLWALGRILERLFGTPRFLVLYLVSGFAGALLSSSFHAGMSVGASGAIFGLLGALAAVAFRRGRILPPTMVANLKQTLWQPIALNVVISFLPGVDALAHAGGAAAGLLLVGSGLLVRGLPSAGEEAKRPEGAWMAGAALAVLAAALSIGLALWNGKPWLPLDLH